MVKELKCKLQEDFIDLEVRIVKPGDFLMRNQNFFFFHEVYLNVYLKYILNHGK